MTPIRQNQSDYIHLCGSQPGQGCAGKNEAPRAHGGLGTLMENIPGGVYQCLDDTDFTLLDMSCGFLSICGYTREEVRGEFNDRFIYMVYPSDRTVVLNATRHQLAQGPTVEIEHRLLCKGGGVIWILNKGKLVVAPDGTHTFYCLMVDITDRKKEQEELRLSLERYRVIMDQATDVIFEWDIRSDKLVFSGNWLKKFGYQAIGSKISSRIPQSPNIHPDDMPAFIKIMRDTADGVPYSQTEFRIRDAGGAFIWCRVRATTQFSRGGLPIKAVGVIADIDAERKQRQLLLEQAQKDPLTGLYNKTAVRNRIEGCLAQFGSGAAHALLIIDLDNFKNINDQYGHLCGDTVLSDVSESLKRLFRSSDIIGRIGGDEFLVFLPGASSRESVSAKAYRILDAFKKAGGKESMAMPLSCSMGIAFYPSDARDYAGLYRCADRALYHVKKNGKEAFAFFGPGQEGSGLPLEMASSAINETIDSQIGGLDQTLVQYTFRMLYDSVDIEVAIGQILEIIGRAYDVSRVYIFENSNDDQLCSNTFEWCNEGVAPEIDNLQGISYEKDLGGYFQNFDENGVFYCCDIKKLHPDLYAILAPQGIESILQCAVMDDARFKGYVGFDECRTNRRWTKEQINSLALVANVLSTFLLKLRLKERLARLEARPQSESPGAPCPHGRLQK